MENQRFYKTKIVRIYKLEKSKFKHLIEKCSKLNTKLWSNNNVYPIVLFDEKIRAIFHTVMTILILKTKHGSFFE